MIKVVIIKITLKVGHVGHQPFVITDSGNFYVIVVLCIYYWSCDSQLIDSIFCFSIISMCDKYNYTI